MQRNKLNNYAIKSVLVLYGLARSDSPYRFVCNHNARPVGFSGLFNLLPKLRNVADESCDVPKTVKTVQEGRWQMKQSTANTSCQKVRRITKASK
jgi:hypothetical protein